MFAATRYFARSYFGGIWPSFAGLSIRPVGISQNIEFGTPTFELELNILPVGIEQDINFGDPTIGLELLPGGIGQVIDFGLPGVNLEIRAVGISQYGTFGTPSIQLEIRATGISQYGTFGTPGIQIEIRPAGFDQNISFGTPEIQVSILAQEILPTGISQIIEFGIPDIWREYISPGFPLEVSIKVLPTEELARINTRRTIPPVQFESLLANTEEILALQGVGDTEMARTIKVIVRQDDTGQIISSAPVTVQSQAIPARGRLEDLADVDATAEVEGGVPVYHSANDTYVTEKLDFGDLADIEEIDGGTFAHKVYINTPNGKQPHYYKRGVLTWKNTDLFMYGETGNWVDIT